MRKLLLIGILAYSSFSFAQPANDNCSGATVLTVDAGLDCSGTTQNAGIQGGECYTNYGGGASEESVWYRVTATAADLNFSITQTNFTNCVSPHVRIFGPFAPGGGCMPACASEIYNQLHNGDPGVHFVQSGLSVGMDYLIQVVGQNCGGSNDRFTEFCVGVFTPATNNTVSGATGIDQCGVTFNGTNIGYTPMNGAPGMENLDGNAGTTCGACTAGDDVSYIINNDSWFHFCAVSAGDWNVDFAVSNCTNSTLNDGLQMTIFRGTPSNLTEVWNAASPSEPGTSQTSTTFSVAAGECIYMVVDGFAGDQCDYTYTLNNLSGGCNLQPLPSELGAFIAYPTSPTKNIIRWSTLSEKNTSHFTLEKSEDGINWTQISHMPANVNSLEEISYGVEDRNVLPVINYYRLKQIDVDGAQDWVDIRTVDNRIKEGSLVKTVNALGQEVNENYQGMVIDIFSDGSKRQRLQ